MLQTKQQTWADSRDKNTLIFAFFTHINPGAFCNSIYVWRTLVFAFVPVLLNDGVRIKGKVGVGIDGHQEKTRISLWDQWEEVRVLLPLNIQG